MVPMISRCFVGGFSGGIFQPATMIPRCFPIPAEVEQCLKQCLGGWCVMENAMEHALFIDDV